MLNKVLVSSKEAAYLLSVSTRHIANLVRAGTLKPVRLGRRVLFDPEQLKALAESWKRGQTAPDSKD